MTMQLNGTRIIVAGAAHGIGAGTLMAFTSEGAQVAVLDIKDELAEDVVGKANSEGPGRARYYHCDITARSDVESAFEDAISWLGGLDVLANVAGVQRRKRAEDFTDEDLDYVFGVNVVGAIHTNQAAFEHLREHGGTILNIGSDGGLVAMPGIAAYSASKGALMSWTRAIAGEWGKYGIRANCIVPAMKTPMTDAGGEEGRSVYSTVPLGGELGDVKEDLAPVMIFMAGPGARFITGQLISVNGGLAMVR
jgi:NAD(P)-dependent dehydrogenase (short-subunit alcohol dehydrogenase family)